MGKFETSKQIILEHITKLCKNGSMKECVAKTETLAKLFYPEISSRQVFRYLKSLKEDGTIDIQTTKARYDTASNGFTKKRIIKLLEPVSKVKCDIMPLSTEKLTPVEIYEQAVARELAITGETLEQLSEQELKYQYEIGRNSAASQILLAERVNTDSLPGETSLEKLVNLEIQRKRESQNSLKLLDKLDSGNYSKEEWNSKILERTLEEFSFLQTLTQYKDNDFYITIYLGGRIPYELPLMNYMGWTENSADFKFFKRFYGKE